MLWHFTNHAWQIWDYIKSNISTFICREIHIFDERWQNEILKTLVFYTYLGLKGNEHNVDNASAKNLSKTSMLLVLVTFADTLWQA